MKRSARLRRLTPLSSAPKASAAPTFAPRDHVEHLIQKLEALYSPRVWAMLSNVRSSTGCPDHLRYADALALHLTQPVDGFEIHGFEVKLSRSDWLRELADPLKCAPMKVFCQAWWLVVPAPWTKILLTLDELPDMWGAIEGGTGVPRILRYAVERRAEEPTPGFLKSIVRAALARAEREDLDGAPMKRIIQRVDREHVRLACDDVVLAPMAKVLPLSLPCFACTERAQIARAA